MKSKTKLPLGYKIIGAALILLSLVMFSTWLMSGLYARYLTSGNAGDGARVATFGEVTITETTGTEYMIIPGVNITKDPTLFFKTRETACYLFLIVNKGNVWKEPPDSPEYDEYKIDNNVRKYVLNGSEGKVYWESGLLYNVMTYLCEDGTKSVYYKKFGPNSILATDIIKSDRIIVSEDLLNSELKRLPSDIKLTFEAYAVQYGDFGGDDETENAIAAYESVKNH